MNLFIFEIPDQFFQFYFKFLKISLSKKNWDYNHATVSWITMKTLVCDMESFYKNISEIRNITLTFLNFQKRRKNWTNSYGLWKINRFEMKKRIGHLII